MLRTEIGFYVACLNLRERLVGKGERTPQCLLFCNESFASTNEREGSEIARQVVRAMLDEYIKVAFVTHMFDLAQALDGERLHAVLFLRAQRGSDRQRSFKLFEGEPLPTSYGEDSNERVFGRPLRAEAPTVPEAKR